MTIEPEKITLIKGRIETADGQVREFQITDEGYSQWGNTVPNLGTTVDALLGITSWLREEDYLGDIPDEEPMFTPVIDNEESVEFKLNEQSVGIRVSAGMSTVDGAKLLMIDTEENTGHIRIMLNDGDIFDGTTDPPTEVDDHAPECGCGARHYSHPTEPSNPVGQEGTQP